MKIAVIHSFYRTSIPSGENQAVLDQVEALKRAGFDVRLFSQETPALGQSVFYKFRSWFRVATGVGKNPNRQLKRFNPDVVHIHNLFPNFSTNWLSGISYPTVLSIHNYRPICAAGTFFRDGKPCFDCLNAGNSLPSLKNRCYRNSLWATMPLALANRNNNVGSAFTDVDKILVLTNEAKKFFELAGWPSSKLSVVPNFLSDKPDFEDHGSNAKASGDWVFAGRFSAEKGILKLLDEWPASEKLLAIGDGPDFEKSAEKVGSKPNIRLSKPVSHSTLMGLIGSSKGLVFPSLWREGLPLVIIEALSLGTPIIARRGSAAGDLIAGEGAGYLYESPSELAEVIIELNKNLSTVRGNARSLFDREFTEKKWLSTVSEIYKEISR